MEVLQVSFYTKFTKRLMETAHSCTLDHVKITFHGRLWRRNPNLLTNEDGAPFVFSNTSAGGAQLRFVSKATMPSVGWIFSILSLLAVGIVNGERYGSVFAVIWGIRFGEIIV